MAKRTRIYEQEATTRFQAMMQAVVCGVTPEDYAEFHALVNGIANIDPTDSHSDNSFREFSITPERGRNRVGSYTDSLKDASEKTLTLRVQMQDVTKPPMWRELKVPADFNFLQLHRAIQAACGFEDCHLWQFQRKAYDSGVQIGIPSTRNEPGLEDCTHDARKTGITAFLAEKGQKLVYVYDFGDDWIFTVSVVGVTPRDGEKALCPRWKSDLQPMEDSGGIWSYVNMRMAWDQRSTLTKRQKKELADSLGYESFDDLEEYLGESLFNLEEVNGLLAEI